MPENDVGKEAETLTEIVEVVPRFTPLWVTERLALLKIYVLPLDTTTNVRDADLIIFVQIMPEINDGFIVVLLEDKDEQSPFKQMENVPR